MEHLELSTREDSLALSGAGKLMHHHDDLPMLSVDDSSSSDNWNAGKSMIVDTLNINESVRNFVHHSDIFPSYSAICAMIHQ